MSNASSWLLLLSVNHIFLGNQQHQTKRRLIVNNIGVRRRHKFKVLGAYKVCKRIR